MNEYKRDYDAMVIIIIIFLILGFLLSGCFYAARNFAIGQGKREIEYTKDGNVKKEKIESKIIPDLQLFKMPIAD